MHMRSVDDVPDAVPAAARTVDAARLLQVVVELPVLRGVAATAAPTATALLPTTLQDKGKDLEILSVS